MADYDSSLPIRTENDGDVVSKIADANTPSQQLAVGADGSINVTDNGGSLTVDAVNLDIRDLVFATDKVDVSGSSNVAVTDGGGSLTVDATDLDIRDLDASQDNIEVWLKDEAGVAFSETNPLPVYFTENPGTEVCDYQTSASLAGGGSVNLDYTVTALNTLQIKRALISGSGKIKAELKVETAPASGVYNTKMVGFNSTAQANIEFNLDSLLKQVAGAKVRITITNRDNQSQDVYSTLLGIEKL